MSATEPAARAAFDQVGAYSPDVANSSRHPTQAIVDALRQLEGLPGHPMIRGRVAHFTVVHGAETWQPWYEVGEGVPIPVPVNVFGWPRDVRYFIPRSAAQREWDAALADLHRRRAFRENPLPRNGPLDSRFAAEMWAANKLSADRRGDTNWDALGVWTAADFMTADPGDFEHGSPAAEDLPDSIRRLLAERSRGVHRPIRSLSAAMAIDIFGVSVPDSRALLATSADGFSRSVREGREILHHLGAWPWCCSLHTGTIDDEWWTINRYREPLRKHLGDARAQWAARLRGVHAAEKSWA